MYWLVRMLSDAVPDISTRLERHLDPHAMVNLLQKKGNIREIKQLGFATSPDFMQKVFALIDESTAIRLFNSASLAEIAAFLEHRIHSFKSHYLSFAKKHLRQRLENTNLADISTFITRLERVSPGGHTLAVNAAETLLEIDLGPHVSQTNLLRLSFLLDALANVDPRYRERLLDRISAKEIQDAIRHSDIAAIQSAIHRFGEAHSSLLHTIADELRNSDFSSMIAASEIRHLSYLLWNIRSRISEELAKHYAEVINSTLQPCHFVNVSIPDLARFIWILVQISERPDLRILEYDVIHNRVKEELEKDTGQCLFLIGAISLVRQDLLQQIFLAHIDLNKVGGPLLKSLRQYVRGKHPYMFSLALQAVWLLDEEKATTLLRQVFRKGVAREDGLSLLLEASPNATPLAIEVLKTTTSRIVQKTTA
jgi:hypothetical protein